MRNIGLRVEDMTGLTVKTAEELQVVNYGIGGHYEPHFDFARREEKNAFKSLGTGNRIATVLFYVRFDFVFFFTIENHLMKPFIHCLLLSPSFRCFFAFSIVNHR